MPKTLMLIHLNGNLQELELQLEVKLNGQIQLPWIIGYMFILNLRTIKQIKLGLLLLKFLNMDYLVLILNTHQKILLDIILLCNLLDLDVMDLVKIRLIHIQQILKVNGDILHGIMIVHGQKLKVTLKMFYNTKIMLQNMQIMLNID